MPYAEIRYDESLCLIVKVIDPSAAHPLVHTHTVNHERTLWRVVTDAMARRWEKSDRDIVLDTVRPYGWVPTERVSAATQVIDVIQRRVCPQCDGWLLGQDSIALCSEDHCGWSGPRNQAALYESAE